MSEQKSKSWIQTVLNEAVELACKNSDGSVASYIPELASVPEELTSISVRLTDGSVFSAGSMDEQLITLQSASKLILLIGLLETHGANKVFSWVRVEPSGDDFASVARLDQFGPQPSNPMLNSGAILLCDKIPGDNTEEYMAWLETWAEQLLGDMPSVNMKVFASERRTGDRNRSLAYLMKSNKLIDRDVEAILESYFYLCSFETNTEQLSHLGMLLANGGKNAQGDQVISQQTAQQVISVMATCGLYNESGTYLLNTGMPGKSSVSGFICAAALGKAGVAVVSPRVNHKGTSIRGQIMLDYLAEKLGWHFAG